MILLFIGLNLSMQLYCHSGEIDDDVIMYLKSLKETERKRRKGLQAMMEISDEPDFNQELDSIDALNNDQKRDYIIERDLKSQARNRIETKESPTYRLLDLIEKRLRAEILELQTKQEVKLLSDILQESTYEVYTTIGFYCLPIC
jgi:hypothetical protein